MTAGLKTLELISAAGFHEALAEKTERLTERSASSAPPPPACR
jgi:hypothetical protein